jgi:hypothetical protein
VGGSQHTPHNRAAQKRLQQVQAEAGEVRVCVIMRVNAVKALERDRKLSELDNRCHSSSSKLADSRGSIAGRTSR